MNSRRTPHPDPPTRAPLVVVGDTLLDHDIDGDADRLAPDSPAPVVDVTAEHRRPGGAGLAAALASGRGRDVVLVTPLGDGDPAAAVRAALAARGVALAELPLHGSLPVKTRIRVAGHPLVRVDRGGGIPGEPGEAVTGCSSAPPPYSSPTTDAAPPPYCAPCSPRQPAAASPCCGTRIHAAPRPSPAPAWPPPTTPRPVPSPRSCPPATAAAPPPGDRSLRAHTERAALLARHWRAAAVAITLAERGVLLARGGGPMLVPPPHPRRATPAARGTAWPPPPARRSPTAPCRRRPFSRRSPRPPPRGRGRPRQSRALARHHAAGAARASAPAGRRRTRRRRAGRGGTVVATGGCFDLLHAGHVRTLAGRSRARRLPRRLPQLRRVGAAPQGRRAAAGRPGRPRRVLDALAASTRSSSSTRTPRSRCCELRPDVWVKGGDYAVAEAARGGRPRRWGGRAVVLPSSKAAPPPNWPAAPPERSRERPPTRSGHPAIDARGPAGTGRRPADETRPHRSSAAGAARPRPRRPAHRGTGAPAPCGARTRTTNWSSRPPADSPRRPRPSGPSTACSPPRPRRGRYRSGWRGADRLPETAVDLHGNGPLSRRLLERLRPAGLIAYAAPRGPTWRPDEHERVRWCRLLDWYGIPADPDDLRIPHPAAPSPHPARSSCTQARTPQPRRWPAARFASVARALTALGQRVAVTAAPGRERLPPGSPVSRGFLPDTSSARTTASPSRTSRRCSPGRGRWSSATPARPISPPPSAPRPSSCSDPCPPSCGARPTCPATARCRRPRLATTPRRRPRRPDRRPAAAHHPGRRPGGPRRPRRPRPPA